MSFSRQQITNKKRKIKAFKTFECCLLSVNKKREMIKTKYSVMSHWK